MGDKSEQTVDLAESVASKVVIVAVSGQWHDHPMKANIKAGGKPGRLWAHRLRRVGIHLQRRGRRTYCLHRWSLRQSSGLSITTLKVKVTRSCRVAVVVYDGSNHVYTVHS